MLLGVDVARLDSLWSLDHGSLPGGLELLDPTGVRRVNLIEKFLELGLCGSRQEHGRPVGSDPLVRVERALVEVIIILVVGRD